MGNLFSKKKSHRSTHEGGFDSLESSNPGQNSASRKGMEGYSAGNNYQVESQDQVLVHTDAVVSLAAIQPGLCISGSKDKTVVLYNYHYKKLEDRWTGHERDITKVCYGEHCRGILSASRDKTVNLWQRGQANPVRQFMGHDLVVSAIHLNKDNTWLCTGSRDNTIKLWDLETGQLIRENRTSRNLVTDVKFVHNTNQLVQTGEDKEVRIFDTRTMTVSHNFPRKQYIQMSCDVSSDGHFCITCSNGFGGNGCEATLWDLRALRLVHEYKGHTEAVEACIFLPFQDRDLIATSSRDCTVKMWDKNTRELVAEHTISCSGPLTSLIAYEDSSICVSSFNEGIHQLRFFASSDSLVPVSRF